MNRTGPPIAMDLPVTEILDELGQALGSHPCAVLKAPPGAGKTTGVPLFLLGAPWLKGVKIIMLAPRRMAARAAAHRMAQVLGEPVGQTVGYRIRMDTKVSSATRIEVITEGVLTRMLQGDPSLKGVGLVIFDEFHERSLNADMGLAICLDMQGVLNADLRLLVMSATMETGPVAAMLGNAPVIQAQGRTFPIETRYIGHHTPSNDMKEVTAAVRSAVTEDAGSILVFLPGAAEIRQVAYQLSRAGLGQQWLVMPLLGNMSPSGQDRAISPVREGYRKIVLATAIAETSLTIDGIGVVVDSGLQRIPRFDVRSGISRLVTLPVSQASANQRRGRAGRLGPGICIRLWSKAMQTTLAADRRPEILEADLCGLVLELARWGIRRPCDLRWLDPPPEKAYSAAGDLLKAMGAIDSHNKITPHGQQMAAMPVHPRLSHMIVMAQAIGQTQAACDLAALLSERDPLHFESGKADVDMQLRYDLLQARCKAKRFTHTGVRVNERTCVGILAMANKLGRQVAPGRGKAKRPLSIGQLLAWAYPDRIAKQRSGKRGHFVLTGGQGVRIDASSPMAAEEFIVAIEADGQRRDGRIYRAAAYTEALLKEQYAHRVKWEEDVRWDGDSHSVQAQRVLQMGALTLRTQPLKGPDVHLVMTAMIEGIIQKGLEVLPWNKALRNWQARVCFLHKAFSDNNKWPDVADGHLAANLETWLGPYLSGITRLRELKRVDLRGALQSQLSYEQHQQLERLAPTHWTVPSGSKIPIDYTAKVPILAVRLQEMFGLEQTPTIAGGRQALLIHLLSPASRPVQVTQDLAGFWENSYHEVKKELKGRYPKHYWPDDPLQAQPTARAKPRK